MLSEFIAVIHSHDIIYTVLTVTYETHLHYCVSHSSMLLDLHSGVKVPSSTGHMHSLPTVY